MEQERVEQKKEELIVVFAKYRSTNLQLHIFYHLLIPTNLIKKYLTLLLNIR